MCGICGKLNFIDNQPVEPSLLDKMCNALSHRGPDDAGFFIDDSIGFGMRRLSIIDLATGHQPIHNEDRSIWIILNGEIYNFWDLRPRLEAKGHRFYTKSDTETLVHLYEDYGDGCVKHLRGMFGLALWDNKKRRLLLARDRVGQKPLFYTIANGSLIFASEIKSILQDPSVKREVNLESLHHFLAFGYVPAPLTMFRGINKLPPAHILISEKGSVRIERYWDLSFKEKIQLAPDELAEKVYELVKEAVKIRLVSDVPLGAFLSGGMDSSTVVGLMSELSTRPVKTFSIGFEESSFNEMKYARTVADYFGTDHHEFTVKPRAIEILPELIWHFDEPFADSSAIPTYYVSKITREHVTVALNGDGGDETFAGYERYYADRLAEYYIKCPASFRERVIDRFLGRFPETTEKKSLIKRLKKFTQAASLPAEQRYARWMSTFTSETKKELYSGELKNRLSEVDSASYLEEVFSRADANNFLDQLLFVDTNTYLPEDLLVKVDRMSMAHSLEARSPFLDHKLMEFAATIPYDLKLKGSRTKYILKKAMSKLVPIEILKRPKEGFGVPVSQWFKRELKELAYQVLLEPRTQARGYFDYDYVRKILDGHQSGKVDHGARIWTLVNLELWHRMFIDRSKLDGPSKDF